MTFSAEGGNFFSAYKVRSKNDGFLGPYSPFLVGGSGLSIASGGRVPSGPFRGGPPPPPMLTYDGSTVVCLPHQKTPPDRGEAVSCEARLSCRVIRLDQNFYCQSFHDSKCSAVVSKVS